MQYFPENTKPTLCFAFVELVKKKNTLFKVLNHFSLYLPNFSNVQALKIKLEVQGFLKIGQLPDTSENY